MVVVEGAQCVRQREYQGVEPGGGGRAGIIITPPAAVALIISYSVHTAPFKCVCIKLCKVVQVINE